MVNILLVDDHVVVRAGVRAILESSGRPMAVEEAGSFEEAMAKVRGQPFDAVVLDISLPGKSGLEILRQIRKTRPALPCLMLSIHHDPHYAVRVLKAGAAGFLDKSAASEQLLEAVDHVLQGRRYVSPEISEHLAARVAGGDAVEPHELLTDREFEVFRRIATGIPTAGVARELSLSPKTVHTHRRNILAKLGLASNADIVRYAYRHGLVE